MWHYKGRTLDVFSALKCLKTFAFQFICGITKAGLQIKKMHQVIEICNRKVPDFSSRIDSQGWSACQAWSGWPPRPDPVGVVHGEAALSQRQKLTLCRIFSTHLFMFAPRRNTAGRRVTQPFGTKCTANISVATTNIFGNRYSNFFCNYWQSGSAITNGDSGIQLWLPLQQLMTIGV